MKALLPTGTHQCTRKSINKDIWIPTHYKQTKTLSENTKQSYKIIKYNAEQKWKWNDFVHIVEYATNHSCDNPPEDTEPDKGSTAVKRYNRIDYEQIGHSYGTAAHYVSSR